MVQAKDQRVGLFRRTGLTTRSDRQLPVAIVGGGASGTILASELSRRGIAAALIEGSGRAGRGIAYSTTQSVHLLNVRAEAMSARAGQPDHFAKRYAAEGGQPQDFAQRRLFGRYLGEILDRAVAGGKTQLIAATATSASRIGAEWRVSLSDGSFICARAVVLAMGNDDPQSLGAFVAGGQRFIANPWGDDAARAVRELASTDGDALLIGTGLTMVDLVLSLDAAGYRGRIVAISRRGLISRPHAAPETSEVDAGEIPGGLSATLRWLRQRSGKAGWRAAVDSLRPHSHRIWQSFSLSEQQRFLRHARPWWDVHRHRIAPQVAETVTRLIDEGQLVIVAGRIVSSAEKPGGLLVEFRPRGKTIMESGTFSYVFNCTGPSHAIAHSKNPLVRSLLDAEEIRPDHLGIGLDISATCRAGDRLWAMGPLTKGRYWEIIAVPDIREQAVLVADDIERELTL